MGFLDGFKRDRNEKQVATENVQASQEDELLEDSQTADSFDIENAEVVMRDPSAGIEDRS